MKELDIVVMTLDLPDLELRTGDIGTIVMAHGNGAAFEVEFCALNGDTIAVETLLPQQIRPISPGEMTRECNAPDVMDSH